MSSKRTPRDNTDGSSESPKKSRRWRKKKPAVPDDPASHDGASQPPPPTNRSFSVEPLEPRIMLSATWLDADTMGVIPDATAGDDIYDGSNADDVANALAGDDQMFGKAGSDQLFGGDGDDLIDGGARDDILDGGDGNDTLIGGAGDDTLIGGAGDDSFDGGGGTDVADFSAETVDLTIDPTDSGPQDTGAGIDTLTGIEQVVGGSGDDTYSFGSPSNGAIYTIDGGGGTNTVDLSGFGASDVIDSGVTLTVDMGGGSSFLIQYSNIDSIEYANGIPDADAGVDQVVNENDVVSLDATGSSDPDGDPLTYTWVQTSGPAVTLDDASAAAPTFTAPDMLTNSDVRFELTVSDGTTTCVDSVTVTINADDDGPTSSAGPDQTVDENDSVTLDGTSSSDPEGQALTYSWVQTSGTAMTLDDASAASPTFTAPEGLTNSSVTFELTVSDGTTTSVDSMTVTINADDDAPDANAGPNQSVGENATVTLDASGTSDPEGQAVTYSWVQTSGPAVTLDDATATSPTFTAPELLSNTDITFELTASDGTSTSVDTVTVTVNADNDAPSANAGPDQVVNEEDTVTLSGSGTDPEGEGLTYTWTQTSGPTVTLDDAWATSPTFDAPNLLSDADVTFQLEISDGTNTTVDTVTVSILADNDAPITSAGPDQTVTEGDTVTLAATAVDPESEVVTYSWVQTAGPAVTLDDAAVASPTFDAPDVSATTVVTFQVTASDGTNDVVDTVDITVAPVVIMGTVGDDPVTDLTGAETNDAIVALDGDDVLDGGAGDDNLQGDAGDDTLIGGAGDDVLDGGDGADTADYSDTAGGVTVNLGLDGIAQNTGGSGSDTLTDIENVTGTEASDVLTGDAGDNVLEGLGGSDTLSGGAGADTLDGGAGSDNLIGGDGDDTLLGGAGSDTLQGGAGDDTIDGGTGPGIDTVSYADATSGVTVDLSDTSAQDTGGGGTDTLVNIEGITGSSFDDVLTGDSGFNIISGGAGDDTISGGGGTDLLFGGTGTDTVDYSDAGSGVSVNLEITDKYQDTEGAGNDFLTGFENIVGSDYDDTLIGDDGDNVLAGGAGDDVLFGGDGADTADYSGAGSAVTVDLNTMDAQNTGGGGTDTLAYMEGVIGSDYDDTLTGTDEANVLIGGAGADTIDGGAGDDTISGGDGDDTLTGGSGDDVIDAGAGDDVIDDSSGDDIIAGGDGVDTLDYSGASGGVSVDLTDSGAQDTGGAGTDTITGIENVIGTDSADTITGGAEDNVLSGAGGDDVLSGGGGADTLDGGSGDDTLSGGDGADILTGGAGSDTLSGGSGDDSLSGGDGDDTLAGGAGDDTLAGGSGSDTADYTGAAGGVTVDLTLDGVAQDTGGDGVDTLTDIENITGSAFDDTLTGDDSGNVIDGGAGDDVIVAGAGDDTLSGGEGADDITGGAGADVIDGGAGDDTLDGGDGEDTISGGTGDDIIDGGAGDDTLAGGAGDDVIDGGSGVDTVTYQGAAGGVTVDLGELGAQDTGGDGIDTLSNIENLTGSTFDDVLTGDGSGNVIEGGGGNDVIDAGGGVDTLSFADAGTGVTFDLSNTGPQATGVGTVTVSNVENVTGSSFDDTLSGDDDDNVIEGGAGDDVLSGAGGADTLDGGSGADVLDGGSGTDTLLGGEGDDVLDGGADDDTLQGGAGDDTLIGGAGDDVMVGGDGSDTADYSDTATAVTVDLSDTGSQNTGGAGNDTLTEIENLVGTDYDDTLTGDAADNVITGGLGDDVMEGGAGSDTASYADAGSAVTVDLSDTGAQNTGGAGTDTLSNFENLFGSAHDDTLTGDAGDNVLEGADGDDLIQGGAGSDTAAYTTASSGVTVDLNTVGAQDTFGAGVDTLEDIENLTGSEHDDVLTGDAGANVISGAGGDDTIDGGAGDDTLDGGSGDDTIDGGLGSDTITGGSGDDVVDGGEGDDIIDGGSGADTLTGGLGDDTVIGGSGDDTITAGVGDDTIDAGDGNDMIIAGDGNDTIEGGSGSDTLDYSASGSAVTLDLNDTGAQDTGAAGIDTVSGVENIIGTDYDDVLTGDGADNTFTGGLGADTLSGGAGSDTLDGGAGDDIIDGGSGADTLTGGAGADTIDGGDGSDTIDAGEGDDTVTAGAGDDIIDGGEGDDTITAGEGDDTVTGGAGADVIDGGDGADTIDGGSGDDTITGGSGADTLTGGEGDDILSGGAGVDVLDGGAGNDTLSGGAGIDIIDGGDGIDTVDYSGAGDGVVVDLSLTDGQDTRAGDIDTITNVENITGSAFDDVLTGDAGDNVIDAGAGDDVVYGGDGDDTLIGGDGTDTLDYTYASGGVTIDLSDTGAQDTGGAGIETVSEFENVTGSDYDDVLTGTAGDNVLSGEDGDDTLAGGDGDDTLDGGRGFDTADYSSATTPVTVDLTLDGVAQDTGGAGVDTLTSIEAVVGGSGDDTFEFSGPVDGDLFSVDGGADGHDTIDLTNFTFADVDFNADGTSVTVDMGGGESFTIDFTNIDEIQFGDNVVLVLNEDTSTDDFSGSATYLAADGGAIFSIEVTGPGTIDWEYDLDTDTLTITDSDSTDMGTGVTITDFEGNDLAIDNVAIDTDIGTFTANVDMDTITVTAGAEIDTINVTNGSGTGTIENLDYATNVDAVTTVNANVTTLSIDGAVQNDLTVNGTVSTMTVTGDIEAGHTVHVTGTVGTLTVDDVEGTATISADGDVSNLVVNGSLGAPGDDVIITIGDDIGTIDVAGDANVNLDVNDRLTNLFVDGTLTGRVEAYDLTTLTIGEDLEAELNILHDLSTLTVTGDVTGAGAITVADDVGTITVGGTFDKDLSVTDDLGTLSANTIAGGTTITVGDDVGTIATTGSIGTGVADAVIDIGGDLTTLTAGSTVYADVDVAGALTTLTVSGGGDLEGEVDAGSVGTLTVTGDLLAPVGAVGDIVTIDVTGDVDGLGTVGVGGDLTTLTVGGTIDTRIAVTGDAGTIEADQYGGDAHIDIGGSLASLTADTSFGTPAESAQLEVDGDLASFLSAGAVNADVDVAGAVTTFTVNGGGDLDGDFDAGSLGTLTVTGDLLAPVGVIGNVGTIDVTGDIAGVGSVDIGGTLTTLISDGEIDKWINVTGDVGTITTSSLGGSAYLLLGGNLDALTVTTSFGTPVDDAQVEVAGNLTTLTSGATIYGDLDIAGELTTLTVNNGGDVDGDLDLGSFGTITIAGDLIADLDVTGDGGDLTVGGAITAAGGLMSMGGNVGTITANTIRRPITIAGDLDSFVATDDFDQILTINTTNGVFHITDGDVEIDRNFAFDKLVVYDGAAETITYISDPPTIDAGGPQTVNENAAVSLGGTSWDPEGEDMTYSWTQVSGTSVTLADGSTLSPSFTAPDLLADENLVFELTVSDGTNVVTDTVTVTVSADNDAPTSDAGVDQSVTELDVVTLGGSGVDPEGESLTYTWVQTGGPSVTLSDVNATSPTFTAPDFVANTDLTFELQVSDGTNTTTDSVTITVNADDDVPSASAGVDQSVVENATITLDASGSTDPEDVGLTYTWVQTSGPSVTLDDATAAAPTFTAPDLVANTDIVFELTASDGTNTSVDTVTITVNADDDAPTASAGPDQSVTENAAVTLDASGSTDPEGTALTYTWVQTSGPTVTLDDASAASPTFTAPDLLANTDITFELTASDGTNTSVDTVTVTVNADNDAPTASAGPDQSADENSTVTLDGTGSTDPEGTALTYTWVQTSGPSVTLDDASAASPTFTAPDLLANTDITFELTASDGTSSSVDTVTVTVNADNDAPDANAGPDQSADENTTVTLDATSSSDPEGEGLTYSWVQTSGPSVTLDDATAASPTFTAPDLVANTDITFELTASDGTSSSVDTVIVTVNADNDAPTASAGPDQSADENTTVTLDATSSSDPEGEGLTYTWVQTSGPSVTLDDAAAASPTFTAPELLANTDITFELTASDGTSSSVDTVTVTVNADNDAPNANAGPDQSADENTTVTLDATSSSDPEGEGLTYTWVQTGGPSVTLDDANAAAPTFTAPDLVSNTDITFELTASDGTNTSVDTVIVTVNADDDAPTADAGPDQSTIEGVAITLDATGSTDPEDTALTYSWVQTAGPAVTLDDATAGTPTFTAPIVPTDGTPVSFEVTVSDGTNVSVDTVTVTVDLDNAIPVAVAGSDQTVDEGDLVTLDASGSSDADGEPLTYTWVQTSGPSVTLSDANSAAPTFTAPEGLSNSDITFEVTASDGRESGTDTVTVTVNADDDAVSVDAGVDQTVTEQTIVNLSATATDPEGVAIDYAWTQTAGPAVSLDDATAASPSFTSPDVTETTVITFEIAATDGVNTTVDTVSITVEPAVIIGTAGDDTLTGLGGHENIHGLAGDDVIDAGAGDDVVFAGAGDDVLSGGAGDDVLDGGDGADVVDYSDATGPVTVDLTDDGVAQDTGEGIDTLIDVEGVIGSAHDDVVSLDNPVDGAVYTIDGGDGTDQIDLGGFNFADADFSADGTSVVVDMGGGESFTVEFDAIETIQFADADVTVLDGDVASSTFTGSAIILDAGELFELSVDDGGSVDWGYDAGTDTVTILSTAGTGDGALLVITDLEDGDLNVGSVTVDSDLAEISSNVVIESITVAGGASVEEITTAGPLDSLTFEGDAGSTLVHAGVADVSVAGDVLQSLRIEGDVGSIEIGGELAADGLLSITGDVSSVDVVHVAGDALVEVDGDLGNLRVTSGFGEAGQLSSLDVGGDLGGFIIAGDVFGDVAVEGDVSAIMIVGSSDFTGNVQANGIESLVVGGDLYGTVTVAEDVELIGVTGNITGGGGIAVGGSLETFLVGGVVTETVDVGGDLDRFVVSGDFQSVLTVGAVNGALDLTDGANDFDRNFPEERELVYDGSSNRLSYSPDEAPTVSIQGLSQVVAGSSLTLSAPAADPEGAPLTYKWSQVSGAPISLSGGNGGSPMITVPPGTSGTVMVEVVVSDGVNTTAQIHAISIDGGPVPVAETPIDSDRPNPEEPGIVIDVVDPEDPLDAPVPPETEQPIDLPGTSVEPDTLARATADADRFDVVPLDVEELRASLTEVEASFEMNESDRFVSMPRVTEALVHAYAEGQPASSVLASLAEQFDWAAGEVSSIATSIGASIDVEHIVEHSEDAGYVAWLWTVARSAQGRGADEAAFDAQHQRLNFDKLRKERKR